MLGRPELWTTASAINPVGAPCRHGLRSGLVKKSNPGSSREYSRTASRDSQAPRLEEELGAPYTGEMNTWLLESWTGEKAGGAMERRPVGGEKPSGWT